MATMMVVPERSLAQRHAALEQANVVRSYRAELKREIRAGRKRWSDALDDPLCATMKVVDVLLAVPKIGRKKAYRALRRAEVSPSKTIGGMTYRQRDSLRDALR